MADPWAVVKQEPAQASQKDPWAVIDQKPIRTQTAGPKDPWAVVDQKPVAAPKAKDPWAVVDQKPTGLNTIFPSARDLYNTASRRTTESQQAINEDLTTSPTKAGTKGTPFDIPLRAAKTAMDVAGVPFQPIATATEEFVGRPYQAAVDKIAGHPVPNAKAAMGDALSAFVPLGESRAAKAVTAATAPIEKGLKNVEKLVSPATVDDHAKAAVDLHKSVLGRRGLEADRAAHTLGVHQRVVGNATPAEQIALIDYVEKGAPTALCRLISSLQLMRFAKSLRRIGNKLKQSSARAAKAVQILSRTIILTCGSRSPKRSCRPCSAASRGPGQT